MPGYNSRESGNGSVEILHGSVQRNPSEMNRQPHKASRYSNVGAVIGSSPTEKADVYSP